MPQQTAFLLTSTVPVDGVNNSIRSFYSNGKYFMFWSDAPLLSTTSNRNNYAAHTCIIIDLQVPGFPITTLGMKILDATVDELGNVFFLLDWSDDFESQWVLYQTAQYNLSSQLMPTDQDTARAIWKFNVDPSRPIPMYVATGQQGIGDVAERKKFRQIELHSVGGSSGSAMCRIYIDGRYCSETLVTPSETPNKARKANLPRNQSTGYTMDVELVSTVPIRAFEYGFDQQSYTS